MTPVPRVLPYDECPLAVRNVAALAGLPLSELRGAVLERLRGPLGCTHLNDMLRALADVPVLRPAPGHQGRLPRVAEGLVWPRAPGRRRIEVVALDRLAGDPPAVWSPDDGVQVHDVRHRPARRWQQRLRAHQGLVRRRVLDDMVDQHVLVGMGQHVAELPMISARPTMGASPRGGWAD